MKKQKQKAPPANNEPPGGSENFIRHSNEWPRWPFLPIKRPCNDDPSYPIECALLWVGDGTTDGIGVYSCNLFNLPPTVEEFQATKKYTYPTITALLADGWVVD